MSSSITSGTTTVMPILVVGYQSARTTQNVFNTVIGRSFPDVSLAPAGPRRGTLTLLFGSEQEALTCEQLHSGTSTLTFADSDIPTAGMTYVADGSIGRGLDSESRALWIVTVDFQEVSL